MEVMQSSSNHPRLPLSTDEFFAAPETIDASAEAESITSRSIPAPVEPELALSPKELSERRLLLLQAS